MNYFYIFPVVALPRMFNMVKPNWRVPMKVAAIACYAMFLYYGNAINQPIDNELKHILLNEFRFFV